MSWKPFSFGSIQLLTYDEEVVSGSGIVYSTAPRLALDMQGQTYFVKGPDREIVFAELSGCLLANSVGLTIPCAGVCSFAGDQFAGTKEVSGARAIEPYLKRPANVRNYAEVFDAIVVDTWLANVDRNMGNIVGSPDENEQIELVFIDFEKSIALRPLPIISSTIVEARRLWPSDDLGAILLNQKPLTIPMPILQSIERMNEQACNDLIQPLSDALGGIAWAKDCAFALGERSKNIRKLAEEVWTCR